MVTIWINFGKVAALRSIARFWTMWLHIFAGVESYSQVPIGNSMWTILPDRTYFRIYERAMSIVTDRVSWNIAISTVSKLNKSPKSIRPASPRIQIRMSYDFFQTDGQFNYVATKSVFLWTTIPRTSVITGMSFVDFHIDTDNNSGIHSFTS